LVKRWYFERNTRSQKIKPIIAKKNITFLFATKVRRFAHQERKQKSVVNQK